MFALHRSLADRSRLRTNPNALQLLTLLKTELQQRTVQSIHACAVNWILPLMIVIPHRPYCASRGTALCGIASLGGCLTSHSFPG